MSSKPKDIFIEGPIDPQLVADSIAKHNTQTTIGAHSIFLGQVRNDVIDGREVTAIDYSTYKEMCLEKMHEIREEIFSKYSLICMHIYHSVGRVKAGQISLFVFTSSPHRKAAIEGCTEVVERIKAELPIWGKEIFADNSYQWKENKTL